MVALVFELIYFHLLELWQSMILIESLEFDSPEI